jgi:hypothetical protein
MSTKDEENALVAITDLTGLGKLAESQLINNAYDDLLSGAAKEFGKGLEEVTSGLRLFAAPFMIMAAWHMRLKRYCDDVLSRVPEERRVEPAPEVAGSIFQSLVFMSEDSPLKEMYLRLLAKAIDRDCQGEAHPAFARLIDQLSPDEAIILYWMKSAANRFGLPVEFRYTISERNVNCRILNGDCDLLAEESPELMHPELTQAFLRHLTVLGLLDGHWNSTPATVFGFIQLTDTDFGYLFMKACVPDQSTRGDDTTS